MLATENVSPVTLLRTAKLIANQTSKNQHTLALRTALRFLINHVLAPGTTDHTLANAKIKALRAIQDKHEQRGHILMEEMTYRNSVGDWFDTMADKHLSPADAQTLKEAF